MLDEIDERINLLLAYALKSHSILSVETRCGYDSFLGDEARLV